MNNKKIVIDKNEISKSTIILGWTVCGACLQGGICLIVRGNYDEYSPHVICLKCLETLGLTYNEPSTSFREESDNAVKD